METVGFRTPAREVLEALSARGASFFADLVRETSRLPSEVEDALWELTAGGLVTADGFENLRALIDPKRRRGEGRGHTRRPRHAAGRWALVTRSSTVIAPDDRVKKFAEQLLLRWGVLFRDLLARETVSPPWRELASDAAPHGSAGRNSRRTLRLRIHRRTVRAPRSHRSAARRPASG